MSKRTSDRPVYLQLRPCADLDTGEQVKAWVADSLVDARLLRDRGYKINDIVRASLHKPRNGRNHRRAHMLGTLIKRNVEKFELDDAHDVIKALQKECRAECDVEEVSVPGSPFVAYFVEPRSIAYDEMCDERFDAMMKKISEHVVTKYWPTIAPDQVEEMAKLMPDA